MKRFTVTLLLLILLFPVITQAQTATPRFVTTLPASCNPTLRTQATVYLRGVGLYTCVPTPNESSATTTAGTYQRIRTEPATNTFMGKQLTVDARDDQNDNTGGVPTAGDTNAMYHSNGTVRIYDMDLTTAFRLTKCADYPDLNYDATTTPPSYWTIRGEDVDPAGTAKDFTFCFKGEDRKYRVTYPTPTLASGTQAVPNDWVWAAEPAPDKYGTISVTDFGAIGDGMTDNYRAIKSAMHWLAGHNGGTLIFPPGDYYVNNTSARRSITIPSNVTIQGAGSGQSDLNGQVSQMPNHTRIRLKNANQTIFRIGELTDKVTIRDIEFYADYISNTFLANTYGIEALGTYTSSQGFIFENLAFTNLTRGIYAHHILQYGSDKIGKSWQWDYVYSANNRFFYNTDAGIYNHVQNSDWNIQSNHFIMPAYVSGTRPANGLNFISGALINITNTFGGGTGGGTKGGTCFRFGGDVGTVNLNGSQCEYATLSFELPTGEAGNYSYPFAIINSILGDPIKIAAARTITSIGNLYAHDTWSNANVGAEVRITSLGDRFCYDGGLHGCTFDGSTTSAVPNYFGGATVLFLTGSPGEPAGSKPVPAYHARFGTPVTPQAFTFANLPTGTSGTWVYCSNCNRATGTPAGPCTAGGTGAPAMIVAGVWTCY